MISGVELILARIGCVDIVVRGGLLGAIVACSSIHATLDELVHTPEPKAFFDRAETLFKTAALPMDRWISAVAFRLTDSAFDFYQTLLSTPDWDDTNWTTFRSHFCDRFTHPNSDRQTLDKHKRFRQRDDGLYPELQREVKYNLDIHVMRLDACDRYREAAQKICLCKFLVIFPSVYTFKSAIFNYVILFTARDTERYLKIC